MKLYQALLVTALSVSVLVGHTSAQESDAPAFGKGRLLKKMRDDILSFKKPKFKLPSFKSNPTTPQVAIPQPKLRFPVPGKSRVPTPAVLPSANSRPAALETAAYRHPIRANVTEKSVSSASSSTQYQVPSANTPVAKSNVTPAAIENVTRSAKKQSLAFGMLLETKDQELVVTQLNPAGNASKAGVRKGDRIIGVGGVELDSMLAFNEITDVLKDGDSLEFLVDQSGKESKKLVLFGKAPEVITRDFAQPSKFSAPANRTARKPVSRTTSNLKQYELVNPASTMPSVIESPQRQTAPTAEKVNASPQTWKYNSGRRGADDQIKALKSAAVRGETILDN